MRYSLFSSVILVLLCFVVHCRNLRTDYNVTAENTTILTYPKTLDGSKLIKKVFNPSIRLMFVAGLEGTGHHAFEAMFTVCAETNKCEKEPIIGRASMHAVENKGVEMHGIFGSAAGNEVMDDVAIIENRMKQLLNVPGDHLYYIGLKSHDGAGMMSYPNYEGNDKALNYPDIFSLALIAESAGFDFRIIVIQRDASDIIDSTLRRGFGKGLGLAGEPKILIASINALYSQLSLLDRKFFECVKYSELSSLTADQKSTLVDFIHPTNIDAKMFDNMLKQVRDTRKSGTNHRKLQGVNRLSGNQHVEQRINPKDVEKIMAIHGNLADFAGSHKSTKERVNPLSSKYHKMLLSHRIALIDKLCEKQ